MATLLDVGIIGHFGSFFVIVLLFAVIFGILEATKPFGGDKKGIYALMALAISLLFLISRSASEMVKTMVPWFIIVVVFIFFVMLLFRMFGVDDNKFKEVIRDGGVYPWIIVFSILVLIGALGSVFGQPFLDAGGGSGAPAAGGEYPDGTGAPAGGSGGFLPDTTSTTTSNFNVNLMNTLRHPKVMGMVFIFLTGAFLMIFLTKPAK